MSTVLGFNAKLFRGITGGDAETEVKKHQGLNC